VQKRRLDKKYEKNNKGIVVIYYFDLSSTDGC